MKRWTLWGTCIALVGSVCAQSSVQVAGMVDVDVPQLNGAELGLLHGFSRY